jgi:hypothetical protein
MYLGDGILVVLTLAGMSFDGGARISGDGTKRSALTRLPGRD